MCARTAVYDIAFWPCPCLCLISCLVFGSVILRPASFFCFPYFFIDCILGFLFFMCLARSFFTCAIFLIFSFFFSFFLFFFVALPFFFSLFFFSRQVPNWELDLSPERHWTSWNKDTRQFFAHMQFRAGATGRAGAPPLPGGGPRPPNMPPPPRPQ